MSTNYPVIAEEKIIKELGKIIGSKFGFWVVGITNDPVFAKKRNNFPIHWNIWKADSEKTAENIQQYFIKKGCYKGIVSNPDKIHVKEKGTCEYIYIF